MAEFEHVSTQTNGVVSHTIGLSDVTVFTLGGETFVYMASAMGGGVTARTSGSDMAILDHENYDTIQGLDADRSLTVTGLDGEAVLIAAGRYGTEIETWEINSDGTLGALESLSFVGQEDEAITAFVDFYSGGSHYFVSASRQSDGLKVWEREAGGLVEVGSTGATSFLSAGAVHAIQWAEPDGVPFVLALDHTTNDLLAFRVLEDGTLGVPTRLDDRDGLFISTPTELEVVELDGQIFAIVGAAGSSSVSVVALDASGQMTVKSQVVDTRDTFFDGLVQLEALKVNDLVFVLAAGNDNGLSLLALRVDGQLSHVASLDDEMREMALLGIGGLDMVWREGGLDIFVTGETLGDTDAGRGITQLRVDGLDGELPATQQADDEASFFGTVGADQFVIEDSGVRQVVNDFDIDADLIDFSNFDQFYDLDQLSFKSKKQGLEVALNGTTIRLHSDDGDPILEEDFLARHAVGLWQIDTTPLPTEALNETGTDEPDLLDGRDGDDFLLAGVVDSEFDAASAQTFRLYQATLARNPDVVGLNNWADRLSDGSYSLVEVTTGFVNSPEFQKTYGDLDNEGFVTLLYQNVLGRAPDETGLANWTARLNGGASRSSVVVGFSESTEFKNAMKIEALSFSRAGLQSAFSDDVFRLYGATLDRLPDESGFESWSLRLAEGMSYLTVVEGFINSAEFQKIYGSTDDRGFVELLYYNVLDRAPDETGLENWTTRLVTGEMSRAQVVQGFSQSTEYTDASDDVMMDWIKSLGTEDILSGGGGNNVLIGGVMSDTFAFEQSTNGHNVIINFEPWDVLSLAGSDWNSVSDIAQFLISDGTNVIFEDADLVIEFRNTTLEQILESEFLF